MFNRAIWLISLLMLLQLSAATSPPAQRPIDSAMTLVQKQRNNQKVFINTCFFIADQYMDMEQYDSAQLWLNKIHALLPIKQISIDNYFLLTRQAEVYYYNNLQQLGLQESRRGLTMAMALNDSLLLADSYNFLGLFYMNIDSVQQSVDFYKQGLRVCKPWPNPPRYISLSKPHHLYGNLAEAYFKLGKLDSALANNYRSLQEALKIHWQRGIAVAHTGLGDDYEAMRQQDSAIRHYEMGAAVAIEGEDIDVALVCYAGMATSYHQLGNKSLWQQSLEKGFDLLAAAPNINRFYALLFLNKAISIYHAEQQLTALVKALELKSTIEKANIADNNRQMQAVLNANLENEKRVLSLQVAEAERKQELANSRLIMVLIGFGLLVAAFLVYRYYQNQQLAVSGIRQKISQDLHDDIGASLSSLQIYGTIAEQSIHTNPAKAIEMVNKISRQAKDLMENMNDIVWSMQPVSSNTSLEIKIKNFASVLLEDSNIEFQYSIMANADAIVTGITARKNILLICKEAMNNIAKYSKASKANLVLQKEGKELLLLISDNGVGCKVTDQSRGNGLNNMEHRTKELNGAFHLQSPSGGGTIIKASFPLQYIT